MKKEIWGIKSLRKTKGGNLDTEEGFHHIDFIEGRRQYRRMFPPGVLDGVGGEKIPRRRSAISQGGGGNTR